MRHCLRWVLLLVLAISGMLMVTTASPAGASASPHEEAPEEPQIVGGDTDPPTFEEAPDPTVPDEGDSRAFAIVLYVLYAAAAVALVLALVRRSSRTSRSGNSAA